MRFHCDRNRAIYTEPCDDCTCTGLPDLVQAVDAMREQVITIFNDSAAMPGNEYAFETALDHFEERVRLDERQRMKVNLKKTLDSLDKYGPDPHNA